MRRGYDKVVYVCLVTDSRTVTRAEANSEQWTPNSESLAHCARSELAPLSLSGLPSLVDLKLSPWGLWTLCRCRRPYVPVLSVLSSRERQSGSERITARSEQWARSKWTSKLVLVLILCTLYMYVQILRTNSVQTPYYSLRCILYGRTRMWRPEQFEHTQWGNRKSDRLTEDSGYNRCVWALVRIRIRHSSSRGASPQSRRHNHRKITLDWQIERHSAPYERIVHISCSALSALELW